MRRFLSRSNQGSFLDGNGLDDDASAMDGLEPPILDETWGLDDVRHLYNNNNNTANANANANAVDTGEAAVPPRSKREEDIVWEDDDQVMWRAKRKWQL